MNQDYPGGQILSTRVLKGKRSWSETYNVPGFENRGLGPLARKVDVFWNLGKARKGNSPLEPLERKVVLPRP